MEESAKNTKYFIGCFMAGLLVCVIVYTSFFGNPSKIYRAKIEVDNIVKIANKNSIKKIVNNNSRYSIKITEFTVFYLDHDFKITHKNLPVLKDKVLEPMKDYDFGEKEWVGTDKEGKVSDIYPVLFQVSYSILADDSRIITEEIIKSIEDVTTNEGYIKIGTEN